MKKQNGFTLVELAIALMVIGLLIGGVLKGQELIENARITATIRQLKAYDAATMIFRNTYNALPGDIKRPNRIPNCTEEICNIGGNGNGIVDSRSEGILEDFNFFPHLTKAGMIQGPEGGTAEEAANAPSIQFGWVGREMFYPTLPIDDSEVNLSDTVYYVVGNNTVMAKLDAKIDDGRPRTGSTMRMEDCAMVTIDGVDEYDITQSYQCGSWIVPEWGKPWWND